MRTKWHWLLLLVVVGALALAAGCGGDDDDEAAGTTAATTGGGEATGGTLVFAGASDPVVLDGALVSDGESLRVITQIFETLVALKPGTTEPIPGLAESWSADAAGKVWTFKIRQGVKFHDGDDARRRSRLLQLRPLVQLLGLAPEPERDLLLAGRLRRLQDIQQGQRRAEGQPLRKL